MRNDTRFVTALLVFGGLAGCAVDDSIAPLPAGGAAGMGGDATAVGAGGKGAAGTTTTSATGGKGGTGTATTATSSGGAGGSAVSAGAGGNVGAGTGGGAGGGAGTSVGTGGASEAGPDGTPSEAGPGDGHAADAVADATTEIEACAPETDVALCARYRKDCGSFLGVDNCGASRAVLACGRCLDDGAVCGSAGTLNLCPGSQPVNRAQGGTVLSTNPMSMPMGPLEADVKAFDNDIQTKWYVRGNATPSIAYDFGGSRSFVVTSYTVTAANDFAERDPASWRLEGSNSENLSNWTTIDTRTNETFADRSQTNVYSVANTTAYAVYRFTVTANNGGMAFGGEFQVAEIQLFGDPPTADAGAPEAGTDAPVE
jgi:hypothetical protein